MNDEGQAFHSGEITKVLGALCQEPETKTKYTSSYTTTIHSSKHLLIQQTLSHLIIYIYIPKCLAFLLFLFSLPSLFCFSKIHFRGMVIGMFS